MQWEFGIIGLIGGIICLVGALVYERQSRQQKRKRRYLAIAVFVVLPGMGLFIDYREKSIEAHRATQRTDQAGRTEADARRSREMLEALVAYKQRFTAPITELEMPSSKAPAFAQIVEAPSAGETETTAQADEAKVRRTETHARVTKLEAPSSTAPASPQIVGTSIGSETEAKVIAEDAREKSAKSATAEHTRLLARYLNSALIDKPSVASVGVAIESETGTMDPSIANVLAQRLNTREVQLVSSFFKPEFVADKFVASIFSGDTRIFDRLALTNWLNGVLIGRKTITYITNAELENTITANMHLEVMALPIGFTRESQSWSFAANGIAFNPHEARLAAANRIVKQIANNTNMVLAPKF